MPLDYLRYVPQRVEDPLATSLSGACNYPLIEPLYFCESPEKLNDLWPLLLLRTRDDISPHQREENCLTAFEDMAGTTEQDERKLEAGGVATPPPPPPPSSGIHPALYIAYEHPAALHPRRHSEAQRSNQMPGYGLP